MGRIALQRQLAACIGMHVIRPELVICHDRQLAGSDSLSLAVETTLCIERIHNNRECVNATFFIIGRHATGYPSIVQREVREGQAIGNHTLDHSQLTRKQ
jgi:hypothetical protein